MKYSNEIIIDLPVDLVVKLFDDPDNLKHWQPGLQSLEHISGERGQPGAKSRILYKMGNREVEMIETIEIRNLPDEFTGTYESKGVWNRVKNRFIPVDQHTTRYISEAEFRFQGLMMKVMGWIMPGAFRKQSLKFMEQFKEFAERSSEEEE